MAIYQKLIRDRIPEIIAASGRTCELRTLEPDEYLRSLDAKLGEELQEYLADGSLAELADLLEVIHAIVRARGSSVAELETIRAKKQQERGGFEQRLFLVRTSD
ncbi:MAG: phosphoribosyl-ATP pyrophosphohydrolase [Mycobacterium leprae]